MEQQQVIDGIREQILEILKDCQYDFDYGHSREVGALYVKMVDRNKASYKLAGFLAASPKGKEEERRFTLKEKENFAIAFAIWAMHDPQAKAFQEAGITAYGLLEKYKDRAFIYPDTSKQ